MKSIATVLSLSFAFGANAAGWNYGTSANGATADAEQPEWSGVCQTGLYQSPIDLDSATYDAKMPNLDLTYTAETNVVFKNNGHTVQVDINDMKSGSMTGGWTEGKTYLPVQVHFHWGAHDGEGSEHFYGGEAYPLEAHIVHLRSDLTLEQALATESNGATPGGLAVVGIQFEVDSVGNSEIQKLADAMKNIAGGVSTTTLPSFDLNGILPADAERNFYSYEGGLTTPGCNMVVQWHNLATPLKVSPAQLAAFRTGVDDKGVAIYPNYRALQARSGRVIKASSTDLVKDLLVKKFHQDYCVA